VGAVVVAKDWRAYLDGEDQRRGVDGG